MYAGRGALEPAVAGRCGSDPAVGSYPGSVVRDGLSVEKTASPLGVSATGRVLSSTVGSGAVFSPSACEEP
ncbi:hypothetical protein GCM10012282_14830 [Streptomyces lacrimifluminis]|uniref:Uncharacterized protein n=1 Tax=Streptomyces lacrimifluminis TaxID=1500077 RepID=A0A917KQE7_9ACTN|nr:hypothetical protein GCM10012282_14830 [Streptomyces lacrimifluminis]